MAISFSPAYIQRQMTQNALPSASAAPVPGPTQRPGQPEDRVTLSSDPELTPEQIMETNLRAAKDTQERTRGMMGGDIEIPKAGPDFDKQMREMDQRTAAVIDNATRLVEERSQISPSASFTKEALDQQLMVVDMRGAQLVQQQTQVLQQNKSCKIRPTMTQAAIARQTAVLKDKGCGGAVFARQAMVQQNELLNQGQAR